MEDKSARTRSGASAGASESTSGVTGGLPPAVQPARDSMSGAPLSGTPLSGAPVEPPTPAGQIVSLEPARIARERENRRQKSLEVPVHLHIGRQLKALYEDVVAQPVPDRFLALLRDIDAKKDGDDVK